MPRTVKSKTIFIVSRQDSQGVQHMGALTSFRAAYQWILFRASIAIPNIAERKALAELRKAKYCNTEHSRTQGLGRATQGWLLESLEFCQVR